MTSITAERSQHLLVVDDDREIRDLASRFLTRHGYRVTAVQDGREMKQALRDWNVDLIILDLMLPGTDGLNLRREPRASTKVPVIMDANCPIGHSAFQPGYLGGSRGTGCERTRRRRFRIHGDG